MFPGVTFNGHVDSIAPASGQEFALLPPDNATGNFTKVGTTPAPPLANMVPVRPKPVKISTKISSTWPQPAQRVGVMKVHTAGALDQRFDDDPRDVLDMSGNEPIQLRRSSGVAGLR
jgi:hypothetical protein